MALELCPDDLALMRLYYKIPFFTFPAHFGHLCFDFGYDCSLNNSNSWGSSFFLPHLHLCLLLVVVVDFLFDDHILFHFAVVGIVTLKNMIASVSFLEISTSNTNAGDSCRSHDLVDQTLLHTVLEGTGASLAEASDNVRSQKGRSLELVALENTVLLALPARSIDRVPTRPCELVVESERIYDGEGRWKR